MSVPAGRCDCTSLSQPPRHENQQGCSLFSSHPFKLAAFQFDLKHLWFLVVNIIRQFHVEVSHLGRLVVSEMLHNRQANRFALKLLLAFNLLHEERGRNCQPAWPKTSQMDGECANVQITWIWDGFSLFVGPGHFRVFLPFNLRSSLSAPCPLPHHEQRHVVAVAF